MFIGLDWTWVTAGTQNHRKSHPCMTQKWASLNPKVYPIPPGYTPFTSFMQIWCTRNNQSKGNPEGSRLRRVIKALKRRKFLSIFSRFISASNFFFTLKAGKCGTVSCGSGMVLIADAANVACTATPCSATQCCANGGETAFVIFFSGFYTG